MFIGILSGGSPFNEFYTEPLKSSFLERLRRETAGSALSFDAFREIMPAHIVERFIEPRWVQNHGFRFFIMEGVRRRPVSGTFYYGGRVLTREDLEDLCFAGEGRTYKHLAEHMKFAGWEKIIKTRCKNWLQFTDSDVLISLQQADASELPAGLS